MTEARPQKTFLAADWAPPAGAIALVGRRALVVGVLFAIASGAGFVANPAQFYRSYLVAFCLVLGVSAGSLAISMLHHMSRGAWGLVIRRILEASSRTLPLVALFAVPLLFGLPRLYPWADPARVASDEILRHRATWMNPAAVIVRLALCFAVWTFFAFALSRLSRKQDEAPEPGLERRMQLVAAPGLAIHCLLVTVVGIDLLMSTDPHWFSSIYGIYVVGGQAIAGMSFTVLVALFLAGRAPLEGAVQDRHVHDWGKLLLTFTMLWAYFAVSQLIIIWSGDLPSEISFYKARVAGGWAGVTLSLALLQFALPFLLLLSADLKRNLRTLAAVAVVLLAMRWVDVLWLVAPAYHPEGLSVSWLDVALPVALFGLWLAAFARELSKRTLLPVNDPNLAVALERHAHG
ncbi:MAG TPA: hypothetical protein VMN04_13340 [Thermoanaerobaculia bacterium]|nr:hypothetical protein [Thermoanaerobaculia bacterium]